MEIDLRTLDGEARLLDVPIDSLKDFVTRFNSRILSDYPGLLQPFFDLTDTSREGQTLKLRWGFDSQGRKVLGRAEYDLNTQELRITTQGE